MRAIKFHHKVGALSMLLAFPEIASAHTPDGWEVGLMLWYLVTLLLSVAYLAMASSPFLMRVVVLAIAFLTVGATWGILSLLEVRPRSAEDTVTFVLLWVAPVIGWAVSQTCGRVIRAHLTTGSRGDAQEQRAPKPER